MLIDLFFVLGHTHVLRCMYGGQKISLQEVVLFSICGRDEHRT